MMDMNDNHKTARHKLLYVLVIAVGGALLWMGCMRTNTARDPTPAKRISRILIQIRPEGGGLARREFAADGRIDGGHSSGDPERIYEEREQISREKVEAIWAAAYALGEEILAMDVPAQPEWDGYVELLIIFDDQSAMRLSWPHGEQYPYPNVQALVTLLLEHDVGGW